jgi:DsbC/DsbD-like thiol-disulfide interchange protein
MALMSYWKPALKASLWVLPCLTLLAQSSGYLTVGEPSKVAARRGASVQARIPVTIQTGFHVNSDKPSEEYLIPLRLTWTATGALEPGAVSYPKPATAQVGTQKLSVFTGSFDLVANFKVGATASAGPGAVAGKLRYQACNDRACFPPKTVEVTVPYQVQ